MANPPSHLTTTKTIEGRDPPASGGPVKVDPKDRDWAHIVKLMDELLADDLPVYVNALR
jgi:hypothetical protein